MIHTLSTTHSTPSFQSHVTLLTKLASTASLLSDLQTTLTEWKKTQTSSDLLLSFEGLGSHASSQNYFQYLFAIINLSPQLASLRQSTRSSLHSEEKRQEEDDYFPHLSLMYGLDDENKNSKEIITSLEQGGECGMTDEGYEVSSRREFVVEEVWAVRCIGKVEDWEVLGWFENQVTTHLPIQPADHGHRYILRIVPYPGPTLLSTDGYQKETRTILIGIRIH
ncbi:hypothetical protein JCM5353_001992 [Sporobolomyces roseus]